MASIPNDHNSVTDGTKIRVAVITGAGRRLGLFLVESLLNDGWEVHAITRKATPQLTELDRKYNPENSFGVLYVHSLENLESTTSTKIKYNEKNISRVLDKVLKKSTKIHLLVNNASIFKDDQAVNNDGMSVYSDMIFMHMILPTLMCQGLSKALSDEHCPGNIVSITDIYAQNPNQDYSLYCSSKAGLESLNKGFAKKYSPGIRVNAIQPGPIKFLPEHSDEHKAKVISQTLLPFEGGFLPIYQTLQFILSNKYLTGASIPVDGGRSLVRG